MPWGATRGSTRRGAIGIAALLLASGIASRASAQVAEAPPDIVLIVVDDLRWDELGAAGHPWLETPNIDRLAREGAFFLEAFAVTPLCSPSRATILTGQYPTRHGILDNTARSRQSHELHTVAVDLQRAGYETAHIGKWHMGNDPTPRPGFDYWVGIPGQGRTFDPELFEAGERHRVEGYVTDLLAERAAAFVRRPRDRPFFLHLAHKAIHPDAIQRDDGSADLDYGMRFLPAPRHAGRYEQRTPERRPNVGPPSAGKRMLARAFALRDGTEISREFGGILDRGTADETIRRRAEMLLAVDESVGLLLQTLEQSGRLDRTLIVLTSDNGYYFGEHGLSIERRLPYEEGLRVPLLIRYPPLAEAGTQRSELALTLDLAPTLLDAAGVAPGLAIQGRSLLPLLRGPADGWRRSFLVEFTSHENPAPWMMDAGYRAVRTERHKYVRWLHHEGFDELYDLEADPFEQRNLASDPGSADVLRALQAELGRLMLEAAGLPAAAPSAAIR